MANEIRRSRGKISRFRLAGFRFAGGRIAGPRRIQWSGMTFPHGGSPWVSGTTHRTG